jgi:putative two-component system response regulator
MLVGQAAHTDDLSVVLATRNWHCQRLTAPTGVLRRLRETDVDIVLLAPDGNLHEYTELCRQIKFDTRTQFICVIFALSGEQAEARADLFASGADDCISLPASPTEVLLRLSNACRMKRTTDSLEDATAVISSLANAIEGRDAYTRGHVERVATYAVRLGQRLGVPPEDLGLLRIGGVVHDIGKVAVPDHILNKSGKLTDEEFAVVKRHPVVGYDILKPVRTFKHVLPIVRWHHERPNGRGYPDGLAGDDLPLLPRIMAVADVFDALSTARAYRAALPPQACCDILRESADAGDLDAKVVRTLLDILDASLSMSAPGGDPA